MDEHEETRDPRPEVEEAELEPSPDVSEVPATLPVLPLKNTVIFPHLLAPLLVNTERSKALIDAVMAGRERLMLAVAVRGPVEGSPRQEDLHRVGTVLRVAKMLRFPDDSYRLLVQGVARARVEEFTARRALLPRHA